MSRLFLFLLLLHFILVFIRPDHVGSFHGGMFVARYLVERTGMVPEKAIQGGFPFLIDFLVRFFLILLATPLIFCRRLRHGLVCLLMIQMRFHWFESFILQSLTEICFFLVLCLVFRFIFLDKC